ncbi:MAG: NADH:ubiquinone oxidoreductase subunit NDUFA12 [Novosphingobium sp.]|uniref:NADH:ubiquinone oxidoreductase subunit NDUFA12 n=1 Tax=Novosphingobium sp. TaxID=1874826 RepID=UPI0032BECA20
MGFFGKIFTWWDGATFSTMFNSAMTGDELGSDALGNRYFRAKKPYPKGHPRAGQERRWVIYNGANDASRVPAEWHGWLHGSFDSLPESNLPAPKVWEADYSPNATGTAQAYRPARAKAAPAAGYEAWSPDDDIRQGSLEG